MTARSPSTGAHLAANPDRAATDFLPLVGRAVAALVDPTAEARDAVYVRVRTVLLRQLRSSGFPSDDGDVARELAALEDAIARVEGGFDRPAAQVSAAGARGDVDPTGDANGADLVATMPNRRQFALNAASSGLVSIFKTLLQLALLPVMARLLGPTAYGIYALAVPTVLFFVLLGEGGFGMSLSREDERNHVVWSTAFWTLLGTCGVLAIGVAGSGFVLARISGQPSLIGLMAFLAVVLPLLAVAVPADARLLRRGNLLYHSGSDLLGSIMGAGVALTLAFEGMGAWALAAQYVTSYAVRAVILNAAAWSPPRFVYDFASLRGHVSTGGALLVGRLGELGSKLAENAAFGHIFGTAPLGAYTLANQMSRFASDAVMNPVLGAFYAQTLRESDAEVATLHARLAHMALLVLLPVTLLMAVAAPDVFPLILGEKWIEAAPLFQAVVVAYALAATAWLSGQILLKHGRTARSAAVVLGCGVLRVGAVMTGLWLSPLAVAWLVGGTYALQAVIMTMCVPRGLGAKPKDLVAKLWGPAAAAVVGAAVSTAVMACFPGDLASAVAASALGASVYLALLFALDGRALRADVVATTRVLRRGAA